MAAPPLADRYLEIVKASLTGELHERGFALRPWEFETPRRRWSGRLARSLTGALGRAGGQRLELVREIGPGDGGVWPLSAETMIGRQRLNHLHECVETVLGDGVRGDLIEAGVWRGGAGILMRAVLAARNAADRTVWLADSFSGLPPSGVPGEAALGLHRYRDLSVPLEAVRAAFARYELLDEQVRFVEGWFVDSLPPLAGREWALVRVDADLYDSTTQALRALYPGLQAGGFLVVDDYGVLESCREAVDEFRAVESVEEPIEWIDDSAIFWRRR